MPTPNETANAIRMVEYVAQEYNIDDAYFVGGYPRALAMGLGLGDVHDLDIASGTPAKAQELAGFVAEAAKISDYEILHRTNTVRLTIGNVEMDFQGSASHDQVAPYVRMWGVEETPIAKNVFDRDFTINSLSIRVGTNEILDLTRRGMSDIDDKRIASILPPDIKVAEDPLLITRAIKFAAKYGFSIEPNLWNAMKKHRNLLPKKLSAERLAIEAYMLSKIPGTRALIDQVGIKYLELNDFIEQGRKEAEE